MPLDKQQINALLSFVASTRENEIACDECLAGMAEFAEMQLVGAEIPDAQRHIHAHIEFCPECAEEYAALLDVLNASSSGAVE